MGFIDFFKKYLQGGNSKKENTSSRSSNSKSETKSSTGVSSIENIMSDLGINRQEMNRLMQINGINNSINMLTQEQVNDIYYSHYSGKPSKTKTDRPKGEWTRTPLTSSKDQHKVFVKSLTGMIDEKINVSYIPKINNKVISSNNNKEYTLINHIGSGEEGDVYEIGIPGRVAKIYNERHITTRRREKIRLMVNARLNYRGICFPLEVLTNTQNEFVGFIMKEAKGRNIGDLFAPRIEFENDFPGWKKQDLVKLAISILKNIRYLHNHDVIMGDVSGRNIMFTSPEEVYFVDTDSYQYDSFPCPVWTENFLAPEIMGRDPSKFMRSEGNENFAIATLLFMLMMQGKQPYSHKGGSQSAADIKAMIFPYGAGKRPVPGNVWNLQPEGLWRYIWSHLTGRLKDAFIDTFRQDGNNNTESTRFSVNEWLEIFNAYNLSMPLMIQNDSMSAEIYPTREKRSREINYRTCIYCREEKPEDMFFNQTTCRECQRKIRNQIYGTFTCSDCGKIFTITNGEREFYESRGYQLPKRCKDCRGNRNY